MKHLGVALKMARTRRGWTKKELSEISGVSISVITEHEESSVYKDWKTFNKLYKLLMQRIDINIEETLPEPRKLLFWFDEEAARRAITA